MSKLFCAVLCTTVVHSDIHTHIHIGYRQFLQLVCQLCLLTSQYFLWPPYVIGGPLYFLPCSFFLLLLSSSFFSSPNLSGRRLDVYTWRGPSANLECRSEMCCLGLAANTGRKKVAKNRHLGTIAQLRRAISLQLRHLSTIGKNF